MTTEDGMMIVQYVYMLGECVDGCMSLWIGVGCVYIQTMKRKRKNGGGKQETRVQ